MSPPLKKFFEVNHFFSNILVPAIALLLYCGTFSYLSQRFLLEGVNYFFVSRLEKYLLFLLAGAVLILVGMLVTRPGGRLVFQFSSDGFERGDLILLLLPLTPVVQYVLINREILSLSSSLYILIFFVFFLSLYIYAIPALLGLVMPTRTLMLVGLAFMFTIVSMSTISNYFAWFESGSMKIQLLFMSGVFLLLWFLYNPNQKKALYIFVIIVFLSNTTAHLFSTMDGKDLASSPVGQNELLTVVDGKTPVVTPNIYLLVYDAYVPNETMLAYGIDNHAQEDYLREAGFTLYPHAYSIGSTTLASMSTVLNASAEYYGDKRRAVSGDSVVQEILKSLGYETYGIFYSDYMFRGYGESYDHSVPEKSVAPYVQLLKAILVGEFRFNIEGEGFGEQPRDQFVQAKQTIFKDHSRDPIFIYTHSNLPTHSQNSGTCLPDEISEYQERLERANVEMQQDVNLIVENDPGAIVIVSGDHGPYLTKNCSTTNRDYRISEISRLDIQDRHGAFLAIRWPTRDFVKYDEITVLQDIFPSVFAYLYRDPAILDAKVDPIIPIKPTTISGAAVVNGLIRGGIDDGQALFIWGDE